MVRERLHLRLAALLVLVLVAAEPRLAHAATAGSAAAFMNDLGTRVLAIINDKKDPETARKQQFTQLVDGAFDLPRIARFVLGRYWRSASDADRQQFTVAFGEQDEGNGTILVTTQILRPESGQPPVKVNWALEKMSGQYKIRDASLEGVSQALTYRDEFSSIIDRNGGQVSSLIRQLDQRANL